jgi:antitoxin (DNA-binding transcriptional repressor) of toxin-antitoxin stability system
MYHISRVKSISVRDLRHRWPEAEKALLYEREIIITRDAKPIAKLTKWEEEPQSSKRFTPTAHRKWQKQVFKGGKGLPSVNEWLERGREDR